ncbi:MAG: GntR family transcriptional regulator [Proteobacteria bacterium]|nr:GntR family transcriptional regulator [Pseudomonadota bacterium]
MLLHISEQSQDTLQEQIIGQIRARILSGDLEPDFGLPSIRVLAKSLQVSVITVQRAYEHLLNEEVIYARRGKGFFVTPLEADAKSALAQQRFTEHLHSLIGAARRDGLGDEEIRQLFLARLQSGDNNGDA